MAEYRKYAASEDSNIEWLGEIPDTWTATRFKTVARLQYGQTMLAENRAGGEIPVYGSNGIVGYHSEANTLEPVIIIGRKGSYGKAQYSRGRVYAIDTSYFIDSRTCGSNLKWLFHAIKTLKLDEFTEDSAIPGLSREYVYSIFVPVPTLQEQEFIADFLDRETEKIDALIAKKGRLIELLDEKRYALIAHAVTKGLDRTVEMKDSGIDWIGKIPIGWQVERLKTMSTLISGQSPDESTYNADGMGTVLVNGPDEYSESDFGHTRARKWTTNPVKYAPKDSLLFCLRGSTTGRLNIAHADVSIGRGVAAIIAKADQRYLDYSMKAIRPYVLATARGSTYPSTTIEYLGSLCLPFPQRLEQRDVVDYLDAKTLRIDTLLEKVKEVIKLLQEYRHSLISAAVTGKIDVRKEVA